MALTYSNAVNAGRLDQIETLIGANAKLKLYGGSVPADVTVAIGAQPLLLDNALAVAASGDWMAAATVARPSVKAKNGIWSGTVLAAAGAGTPVTFFRITSAADVAGIQGTCGQGTGDLQFDNATLATGQTVTVNTFTITSAN